MIATTIMDMGGRRSGVERRLVSLGQYIRERRSGQDRRVVPDRRNGLDRRSGIDRRETYYAEPMALEMRSGQDRRCFIERRAAFA